MRCLKYKQIMMERDNNGNPIDEFNHALDECRYTNNYFFNDIYVDNLTG